MLTPLEEIVSVALVFACMESAAKNLSIAAERSYDALSFVAAEGAEGFSVVAVVTVVAIVPLCAVVAAGARLHAASESAVTTERIKDNVFFMVMSFTEYERYSFRTIRV